MDVSHNNEQVAQSIYGDFLAVSGYISSAMQEVALELGGEDLAEKVTIAISGADPSVPSVDALNLLEETFPGSIERVMLRSSEIQHEAHERELAEFRKPSLKKYGRAILQGTASFNIFGVPPKTSR